MAGRGRGEQGIATGLEVVGVTLAGDRAQKAIGKHTFQCNSGRGRNRRFAEDAFGER